MLVSKRPLKPQDRIAAAELNPSTAVDGAVSSYESTLEVDLLIQTCKGLLLLDTTLGVVRFSHLSVQEYLETKNEIWDVTVTDAQLFVAESCLWTLQAGYHLNSPLYEYSAFNWFKHCRSYQGFVVSTGNINDTKHKLSIPLLDSFLGSFKQGSASYVKWADWVGAEEQDHTYTGLECVLSTPLYPAFSAVFAGLGELVSWLWQSEGNDMNIKNQSDASLLDIAGRFYYNGAAWIVAEVLRGDCDINHLSGALDNASLAEVPELIETLLHRGADVNFIGGDFGTALAAAAVGGSLEVVKLLLDRGANVNLRSGYAEFGTALEAAAYKGNTGVVTLLLDRGVDVNLIGGNYGTALGAAAHGGIPKTVKQLLDRNADANIAFGGYYGTALGAAAFQGDFGIINLLLSRGADINGTGGRYGTALTYLTAMWRTTGIRRTSGMHVFNC